MRDISTSLPCILSLVNGGFDFNEVGSNVEVSKRISSSIFNYFRNNYLITLARSFSSFIKFYEMLGN